MTTKKMSHKEFREAIEALGLTGDDRTSKDDDRLNFSRTAELLGISKRAAYYYAGGDYDIPAPVAKLLRLWLQIEEMPPEVRKRYGLMIDHEATEQA